MSHLVCFFSIFKIIVLHKVQKSAVKIIFCQQFVNNLVHFSLCEYDYISLLPGSCKSEFYMKVNCRMKFGHDGWLTQPQVWRRTDQLNCFSYNSLLDDKSHSIAIHLYMILPCTLVTNEHKWVLHFIQMYTYK